MIAEIGLTTVLTFVLVFGFAPGFVLRLLVMIYPKDVPRRHELVAELYTLGRVERLLFVGEQFETALFEGIKARVVDRRQRRARSSSTRLNRAESDRDPGKDDGKALDFEELKSAYHVIAETRQRAQEPVVVIPLRRRTFRGWADATTIRSRGQFWPVPTSSGEQDPVQHVHGQDV